MYTLTLLSIVHERIYTVHLLVSTAYINLVFFATGIYRLTYILVPPHIGVTDRLSRTLLFTEVWSKSPASVVYGDRVCLC